jgi:hypothetical protein
MDQVAAKKILQELIKREDLKNKTCVDCGNPNPQWASGEYMCSLFLRPSIIPRKLVLRYFCACNAPVYTEASECTSGEFTNLCAHCTTTKSHATIAS